MKKTDKCVSLMLAALFMLSAAAFVTSLHTEGTGQDSVEYDAWATGAVPATDLTGVPNTATVGVPLTLSGTVTPGTVTVVKIVWSVKDPGTTGASISDGNRLNAAAAGTATVTAKVVYDPAEFVMISAGGDHMVGIKTDGTMWAWGRNGQGQLGINSTTDSDFPVQVGTDTNWAMVSAGAWYTMAIKTNGTLWAWGMNSSGTLGLPVGNVLVPTQITTTSPTSSSNDWAMVTTAYNSTLAIKTNGTLWAWGMNQFGQIGNNSTTTITTPTRIGTDTDWATVSVGANQTNNQAGHTVAIKTNGTLWAWGRNTDGECGLGTSGTGTDRTVPTQVGTDTNWKSVSAGANHTVALKTNGTLWAWGANNNGQLGDGTNVNKTSPVRIGFLTDWTAVSAGDYHTAVMRASGALYTCGSNSKGQLGDGTSVADRNVLVRIGADAAWSSVSAGMDGGTIAIRADGTLWAWGNNEYGQIGDGTHGTANNRAVPTETGVFTKNFAITVTAPAITTGSLPNGTVGTAYSQSLTSTGIAGTVTWTRTSGTLPTGLTLSGATISGTPTAAGTFTFTIRAANSGSNAVNAEKQFIIHIVSQAVPEITSGTLAGGTVGATYSQTLTATGVTSPSWSLKAGSSLPSGLSLSTGGAISGTPTVAGTFPFTVTVTGTGGSAEKQLFIYVAAAPAGPAAPEITSGTLANGTVGATYSQTLTVTGITSPSWSVKAGSSLPAGLSLNASSGSISGTPTVAGTFPFTMTVTGTGGSAEKQLFIYVAAAPSTPVTPAIVSGPSLSGGTVGTAYVQLLVSEGITGTVTWTLASGTLPGGLTLSSEGVISGTPTASGTFSFTISASNGTDTDSKGMSIVIASAPSVPAAPEITSGTLANGTAGTAYSETLTVTGITSPSWSVKAGSSLPSGLSLSTGGAISGTPTVAGTFPFTVTVTGTGGSAEKQLFIYVAAAPAGPAAPEITSGTLANGTVGTAYSQTLTSNVTGSVTWSVKAGSSLPSGLILSAAGAITGTPTVAGTFPFTVTASNGSVTAEKQLFIYVAAGPAGVAGPEITSGTLANGTVGTAYSETLTSTVTGSVTWSVRSGSLPNGLSLSASGAITGTPTVAGTFPFTVRASNGSDTAEKQLFIYIAALPAGPAAPEITSGTLVNGTAGTAYSQTLTVTGITSPSWSVKAGSSLPAGLSLSTAGVISGTPTTAGTFPFTVTVTGTGGTAEKQLFIYVAAGPAGPATPTGPAISSGSLFGAGIVGTSYSQTLTADGITAPIWSIQSGSLPGGLTLSSGGIIFGTPTASGTFNLTVRAANGGNTADRALTIVIAPAAAAAGGDSDGNGTSGIDPITIVLAAVAAAGVAAVVSIVMRPKH